MLFGTISLLGGHLDGFTSEEATGWRVLFIAAALGALHLSAPRRRALKTQASRIARSPRLILIVVVNAAIMWVQLWVFLWGPARAVWASWSWRSSRSSACSAAGLHGSRCADRRPLVTDEPTPDPWADRQLVSVLASALGAFGCRTRLDANVAAKELGVSPSTVRRWVRNGIPERRRDQVAALVAPEHAVLERERRELLYSRDALWDIAGRGAPINDSWKRDGWLRPHLLTVVQLLDRGVLVVRLTNLDSGEVSRRLRADGGEVIEEVEFRNRFRAQVAKGELLEAVGPSRVIVPSGRMSRGRTQAWLASAPRPGICQGG